MCCIKRAHHCLLFSSLTPNSQWYLHSFILYECPFVPAYKLLKRLSFSIELSFILCLNSVGYVCVGLLLALFCSNDLSILLPKSYYFDYCSFMEVLKSCIMSVFPLCSSSKSLSSECFHIQILNTVLLDLF